MDKINKNSGISKRNISETSCDKNIECIAKQISDHADIIYEAWKSSGLSPRNILNCSNMNSNELSTDKVLPDNLSIITHKNIQEDAMEHMVCSFISRDKANRLDVKCNHSTLNIDTESRNKPTDEKDKKRLVLETTKDLQVISKSLNNKILDSNATSSSSNNINYIKGNFPDVLYCKKKNSDNENEAIDLNNSNTACTKSEHMLRKCISWGNPNHTSKSNCIHHTSLSNLYPICKSLTFGLGKCDLKTQGQITVEKHTIISKNGKNSAPKKMNTDMDLTSMVPTPAPNSMPSPAKIKHRTIGELGDSKERIRPFLSRGSVAERVLMFEKCPDLKHQMRKVTIEPSQMTPKHEKENSDNNKTLQKLVRDSATKKSIPRFFFPHGKPQNNIASEKILRGVLSVFDSFPNNQVTKENLPQILNLCGLPFYWRVPILLCTQKVLSGLADGQRFIDFWKQMSVYCSDAASKFVYILSKGQRNKTFFLPEDLIPLVQDVVDTHPGLAFLKDAKEFHSRYVHTVIARIFYTVNRSWSGRITVPELRRSNLLQIIQLLHEEEDINQIMAFFSYEHFYVIYCKFWELDTDHDLLIDQHDLEKHSGQALSTRIIERIFSGCVTKNSKKTPGSITKMTYTEFVWFLLSEEDKTTPTAIEYWFRCMDLDGDGTLSMYELEYFYEEQQQRMESIGIETLPYEDCLCQMLDIVKPAKEGCITLRDLKACRLTPLFFDTFFNLEKYLDHEQRDPFATQKENDFVSDWDKYAALEYELLVADDLNE